MANWMTPLFKKLNLGENREILVLNAPDSFDSELAALDGVKIKRDMRGVKRISFAIYFVQTLELVEAGAKTLAKAQGIRSSGSRTRKAHQRGTSASSIAIAGGCRSARRDSKGCARWRSMKIGLRCVSGGSRTLRSSGGIQKWHSQKRASVAPGSSRALRQAFGD